jgi:anthranilate phosphoribosyltransferase
MDFFNYIHAVGTGTKGNRDLTFDESVDMMTQILEQSVSREQIAAFLLGWRLKPESIDEFRGAVKACDEYIAKTDVVNSIELGYPFDGKVKNPYIFPLIAKVLKPYDINLVLMGDDIQPAKGGITIKQIAQDMDFESNIYYFDRMDYFSKMHDLTEIRNNLGLRTAFNTIEKLPNISNSKYAITGVFHKPYVKKYIKIFAHRYKKFALIQGNEGTPELFSKGRLWVNTDDILKEYIIDPKYYGIEYQKSRDSISYEKSIYQLQNPDSGLLKLAKLNAAIYLFIVNKADSIDEAFEQIQ